MSILTKNFSKPNLCETKALIYAPMIYVIYSYTLFTVKLNLSLTTSKINTTAASGV